MDNRPHPERQLSADEVTNVETFKPVVGDAEHALATSAFHLIERILLVVVAVMTVGGAITEIVTLYETRSITLASVLLMFLYTEVIGMVRVFYTGKGATFVYPIFIAVTALARLIVLQSKEMAPQNIVFEASAILLLALSAIILMRVSRPRGGRKAVDPESK